MKVRIWVGHDRLSDPVEHTELNPVAGFPEWVAIGARFHWTKSKFSGYLTIIRINEEDVLGEADTPPYRTLVKRKDLFAREPRVFPTRFEHVL